MGQLLLLLLSCVCVRQQSFLKTLSPRKQYYKIDFNREIFKVNNPQCYYYGIYTRYNPLSDIQQVGDIGILDSNCFHIYSAIDKISNRVNFLYYDCIDYENQQIVKSYTFIGNDGKVVTHSYQLKTQEYESYWYFLGIMVKLIEKKVSVSFFQNLQLLDTQEFDIQYPNYDTDLIFIYGGGLLININQIIFNEQISKLSFFPGSYFLLFPSFASTISQCQESYYYNELKYAQLTCRCKLNNVPNIPDIIISNLIQEFFISEYLNCDSFNFQSWIRIKERNYFIKEIYYQLIKISSNFQNPKLQDDDLCAFQLFYKLTSSINQIIITTYSYTFPTVNIASLENPFLIKTIFDIDLNIQLWHFIRVKKSQNSILVNIYFYEGRKIKEYKFERIVNHFNLIRFKIAYGNILQTLNYLTIQLINMIFLNCEKEINTDQCHLSCLECDGPTKFDCLSCDPTSFRNYNEKQKACVCVYGKIELDGECKDYSSFQLSISQEIQKEFKCSHGYFESEGQCWKCPSKIKEKLITCIECITNPKSWINNPYCQYNFVTNNEEIPFTKLDHGVEVYFFDGKDIKLSENQENHSDIYLDYLQTYDHFTYFCQNCQRDLEREQCFIFEYCEQCEIQIFKPQCTKCVMNFALKDGTCTIKKLIQSGKDLICETPYYQTYYNTCILCPIINCLYCFDYLKEDIIKNTIVLTKQIDAIDEQVLVGCAQCFEGYIYDFTIGQCLYQQPQIQNCLRSYVDQQGKEICIVSSIDDFKIAPQILNCENQIFHCKQCFQNLQTIVKCLICEKGYLASDQTGYCEIEAYLENSKSMILFYDQNIWRYIVQSFAMLFTKINQSYIEFQVYNFAIDCLDGYSLNKGKCVKYCDQNCQTCQKQEISESFTCSLCSLNIYLEPYRVQENGRCIICPSLCLVCQTRSQDNIESINPYYIINETNTQYTTQCIKSISGQNIYIDPDHTIAQYIYKPYQAAFEYTVLWSYDIHNSIFSQDQMNYFENNFDFTYFNEIGLQQFILTIEIYQPCQISSLSNYTITNQIQTKVFSIKSVKLKLQGDLSLFPLFQLYQIQNFNQVEFSNLFAQIDDDITFEFYNRGDAIDYKIVNTSLFSDKPIKLEILINDYKTCDIQNMSILNAYIDNSIIFQLNSTIQHENIIIEYFFLQDCIINNSVLFNFHTTTQDIIIENLFIERCELNNFTLINIQQQKYQSKLRIRSLIIKNSILSNSLFVQAHDNNLLYIYSFQMIENQIINSQIIKFTKDLFSFNCLIKQNLFKESILFQKYFSLNIQYQIKIDDFDVESNIFQNFQVLVIDQNILTPTQIELTNFIFKDNTNPSKEIQDYLLRLTCSKILIQNVTIINTFNHRYFYLFNISQIILRNISVQNQIQEYRIPLHQDCIINNYQYLQLLSVKGFRSLYLVDINFTNLITIDQSFIQIQSNELAKNEDFENIMIQNISLTRNILMKISQGNIFSIISIISDKVQQIYLENIFYQENSYYQYILDPTFTSSSLLFINSIYSSILLKNIYCFENSLANSTNSFITISSSEVKVEQIKVSNHNYLRLELWNRYYDIQISLLTNLNQIEVNYMIEQVLSIKNKGGAMQVIADKFTLENGYFQYLISRGSSVLDINTKGKGIVVLNNCSIAYSQNNLLLNQEQEGSISINSQNSYLNLLLQNFNFTDILNNLAPAIISFNPSEVSNIIIIKNIQVSNCFSLINLFLSLSFPFENADQNKVIIENILIQQNIQASIQFNKQLNILEQLVISKVTQDNAIFNIQGCQLIIRNFIFEGFTLSSILNLINCKTIQLVNIFFKEITLFYNLNLLQIEQVSQYKSIILIQILKIYEIKKLNIKDQNLSPYIYPNFLIEYTKCETLKAVQLSINEQQLEKKTNNFEQIQSYSTQDGSILYMKFQNNQTKVHLKSIFLQYNDCITCKNGLIFFQLVDFLQIKIEELYCIGNIVQQFGCITTLSDIKLQGKLQIMNSLFINNNGSQGLALSSINVKTFISNVKILNNTATLLGGGLYLNLNNADFVINSTYIQHNKAMEGGGIYQNGESILSEINFVKSLLNFNKAELTTDNIQELPSHLEISINHQIMPSEQSFDSKSQKSLKLSPYKILQQGKVILSNKLMIPSNQEISKYELYNPKLKKFSAYINEFSIQLKNRFNEQLLNFTNSTCQIMESIIDIKKQVKLSSSNASLIYFNQTTNNFDLGMLIFTFDPYNQTDKQYEIEIYCKTKSLIKELSYKIKVQSLICQLGEFNVLNGCLTCQSTQGFYSVIYNATKCSIFDKTKFEAITSNNIKLKPGYWRPHQESDLVNDCFKNIESCKGGWAVGDDICKIGHIGGLCEECDKHNTRGDGYYFKNDQFTCLNCSNFSINILSLVLITIWVFLSAFITLTSVQKTNQLFASLKLTQNFAHILFKMNINQESILLKLLLNYIWIFSVIFTFNIQFSFSFIFVNQMSDTSYFLTRNLDCEISQSFETELIYIRVLGMFTLISLQIFIIQLTVNIFIMLTKGKFSSNISSITIIYLYIQNYAALINQLFSILAKREISRIDYVQGDVSLLFQSLNHQAWIYKFALPLSLLIGLILPISLLLFLYKKRNFFDKIQFRRHIGYLFNEYNTNSSFWEWVKLWKKTIIIVILIYFETNIFLKGILIAMCLMIYQIITSSFLPYIYPKLNKLDLSSGQFCSIAIFLAAVQYICEQQGDQILAQILQILIALICFRFSFPYLFDIISAYYKKYKENFLTYLIIILKKLFPQSSLIWKFNDIIDQWRQKNSRIDRNFKQLRKLTISKKRQEKKEQQQIYTTLSLNKVGEAKLKLLKQ